MTTWTAPQLLPGAFGVPVPTVLIAPWQLDARINVAHMNLSDDVDEDEIDEDTTADNEAVDRQEGSAMADFTRVVTADQWSSVEPAYPLTVYRHDNTGCTSQSYPAKFWSLIPIGWSNTTWDEAAGRVMVATADPPTYWSAVEQGRFPTFQDTFGDGCWAALAPFDTGPEADLSTWPGAGNFGL